MTKKEQVSSHSQSESAIHIRDILKPEWTVSQQSIQLDSLIVQHDFVPSGEIEHPPLNHHMIGFLLTPSVSAVSQIGQEKYEGLITKGNCFVNPSGYSGLHAGGNNIETITLIVKPDFLCRIAAESECVNPDKIELHPIIKAHIGEFFITNVRYKKNG